MKLLEKLADPVVKRRVGFYVLLVFLAVGAVLFMVGQPSERRLHLKLSSIPMTLGVPVDTKDLDTLDLSLFDDQGHKLATGYFSFKQRNPSDVEGPWVVELAEGKYKLVVEYGFVTGSLVAERYFEITDEKDYLVDL